MTKTDLIAQVAANTEMSKKSAEQAVNAVFEALGKAMAEGEKITISGFGTFEVRERAEYRFVAPVPAARHRSAWRQRSAPPLRPLRPAAWRWLRQTAAPPPSGHPVPGSSRPEHPARPAAPGSCPEETCEVLEAIDADDPVLMQEELGDVLMQVAFHAVMEEERGHFTFEDVCREVCEKLVFRHPNIFASSAAENAGINGWDALKNKEKGRTTLADELAV